MPKSLIKVRDQLINGDQSYIENVFVESYEYATAYLKKKKHASNEEAHDIYIDAIMIIRERIVEGSLTEVNNIRSFIVGVCINLNKELLYKKYKAESREQNVRELFYKHGYKTNENEKEDEKELKRICKIAISQLGEKCQKLLNMYHYEGLTMSEIAEIMGFASSNVAKTMKSRCFQKLIKEAHKLRTLTK